MELKARGMEEGEWVGVKALNVLPFVLDPG